MGNRGTRLHLLGDARIEGGDGQLHALSSPRALSLLALLACRAPHGIPRDAAAELLWPDAPLDQARGSLNTIVWTLRRELTFHGLDAHDLVRSDRSLLAASGSLTTDARAFQTCIEAARTLTPMLRRERLEQALEIYRGDLLPGSSDEWVYPERTRLRGLYLQSLADLADLHAASGELEQAVSVASRALQAEPMDIAACLRLIRLYTSAGKPAVGLRLYEDFVRQFRDRMAMEPGGEIHSAAEEARSALAQPPPSPRSALPNAPIHSNALEGHGSFSGGALPPDSPYYLRRPTDDAFKSALIGGVSVVLIHGPRQTGKSSLLAQGLREARAAGREVAFLDLQTLGDLELAAPEAFYYALARSLADQLEMEDDPRSTWEDDRGAARNLRHYLRRSVLPKLEAPLVWAIDEVDRLFTCPFGNEVFGLFRSWHNERALDPQGPWRALTLALTYATEAHLFISDLNQSPFNIGVRLELSDFTRPEALDLARRLDAKLTPPEMERALELLGGHPYLLHRAFHALANEGKSLDDLEAAALDASGPFSGHLSRLSLSLSRDGGLVAAIGQMLRENHCPDDAFWRLRSAGILTGSTSRTARFRCGLYERHLRATVPSGKSQRAARHSITTR